MPVRLTLFRPLALIIFISLLVAVFDVAALPVCPQPPEPAPWDGRSVLTFYRDVETCRIFSQTIVYSPAPGYTFLWREDSPAALLALAARGARIVPLDRWLAGERTSVREYFNSILGHYLLVTSNEWGAIDRGEAGPGWSATGNGFTAREPFVVDVFGRDPPLSAHVERFYGSVSPGPNSHFFTIDPAEARILHDRFDATPPSEPRWRSEGYPFNAFRVRADGTCDSGKLPVLRAFNNGPARGLEPNHRYSVDGHQIEQMASAGWIVEGIAFCVDAG